MQHLRDQWRQAASLKQVNQAEGVHFAGRLTPIQTDIEYSMVVFSETGTALFEATFDPGVMKNLTPHVRRYTQERNSKTVAGRLVAGSLLILDGGYAQGDKRPLRYILVAEVSPRFQRQGISTKLYLMAKEWADRKGYLLVHHNELSSDALAWIASLPGEQFRIDKPTKQRQINYNTFATEEWSLKRVGS